MGIIVRYDILTKTSSQTFLHDFYSQKAAQSFLDRHLPKYARNLDVFFDLSNEPKQNPTTGYIPRKASAWEQETGKRLPDLSCPIEIMRAKPARRRMVWA